MAYSVKGVHTMRFARYGVYDCWRMMPSVHWTSFFAFLLLRSKPCGNLMVGKMALGFQKCQVGKCNGRRFCCFHAVTSKRWIDFLIVFQTDTHPETPS